MLSLVRNLITPLIEGSPVVLQHSLDSNHPIIPLGGRRFDFIAQLLL